MISQKSWQAAKPPLVCQSPFFILRYFLPVLPPPLLPWFFFFFLSSGSWLHSKQHQCTLAPCIPSWLPFDFLWAQLAAPLPGMSFGKKSCVLLCCKRRAINASPALQRPTQWYGPARSCGVEPFLTQAKGPVKCRLAIEKCWSLRQIRHQTQASGRNEL